MADIAIKDWVRAVTLADIPEGQAMAVELSGKRIAIFHVEGGEVYATDDGCTHGAAALSEGFLDGCSIECPLHAGCFDVRTGEGLCDPIEEPVQTYSVLIKEGDVFVQV